LYTVITIGKPRVWGRNDSERKKNEKKVTDAFGCETLDDCVEKIAKNLESIAGYLQIGGNETVGKGFVKAKVWGGEDEHSEESGTEEV
jgi:CRISPR/Cas system CMR subunit Cmr4 (Cas7 group RAMP superfamily)